ncbi:hypothetical protein F4781DRAFT_118060 [Annulohypoxylon bovei var. microspora]|nr:hypothetical protein F4781DRAFT_118060 [Annulohypoxylon bovei var. microspora]
MSTTWDYDVPKESRPEGSRNFPLVFPSYADTHPGERPLRWNPDTHPGEKLRRWNPGMHPGEKPLRWSPATKNRVRDRAAQEPQGPPTQGFPAYGRGMPWLDADYPFSKLTTALQCPEPESDGQESIASNTPKVVLPPPTHEEHDFNVHTPIRGHRRQISELSLPLPLASEDFADQHQSQGRVIRPPPGFTQQPQGRTIPGHHGLQVPADFSSSNDSQDRPFVPSRRQIITDSRQTIVDSPTFTAQYAPMQTRPEYSQDDFWYNGQQQEQMAGSPVGSPMGPQTPLSHRSRRAQRLRKHSRKRQILADQMAREEAARGFDSEDDNEFYPHED